MSVLCNIQIINTLTHFSFSERIVVNSLQFFIHREKATSNKTLALTKSTNMCICIVGTSNKLFMRGSLNETKFSKKKKLVTRKTPFFGTGPFCTHHSVLTLASDMVVLDGNDAISMQFQCFQLKNGTPAF